MESPHLGSGEQELALGFHLNFVLIIISIFLGNGSDYIRSLVRKDPSLRCRPLLRFLTDFPEATLATLVGAGMGLILTHGWGIRVHFSESVFFYFILPPIIFYQGYSLKKKNFFRFFHYIFTLGVVGTIIQYGILIVSILGFNRLWYALHLPVFGWGEHKELLSPLDVCFLAAVLTSADEVAALAIIKKEHYPKLSAVLFGEGVVNDAVSILLFRSVLSGQAAQSYAPLQITWRALYLMTISMLMGFGIALVISRVLKVNTGLLEHPTRQTIIIMCGCYISYAAAEMVKVPGVLGVFVCGIIFSHYAWHSLAPEAKVGTAIFSHSLSTIAETYSFTALGLSVFRSVIALIISRFIVVFGIFMVGRCVGGKYFNMSTSEQCVLFVAGLIRGAITWAQALQMPGANRRVMISSCLTVIAFTLTVVGGLMPSILRILGFEPSETTDPGEIEGVGHAQLDGNKAQQNGGASRQPILKDKSAPAFLDMEDAQQASADLTAGQEEVSTTDQQPPKLTKRGSWDGIILHGRVHRCWAHLDETLKPFFGGKSRLESTALVGEGLPQHRGYGTLSPGPDSAGNIDPQALAILNATRIGPGFLSKEEQHRYTPRAAGIGRGTFGSSGNGTDAGDDDGQGQRDSVS